MAKKKKEKKQSTSLALNLLFPGRKAVSPFEERNVDLPSSASGYFNDYLGLESPTSAVLAMSGEDEQPIHELPVDRIARYTIFEAMSSDPTIDSALKMHIAQALSADAETDEIISIESTTDSDNEFVKELRDRFKEDINRDIHGWAYTAGQLGVSYARIYGEEGVGITHIRNDYYTHPRFVKEYTQAGKLAGYVDSHQDGGEEIRLMDPWEFVGFKIPYWSRKQNFEPERVDSAPINIADEDYTLESISETVNYGSSLFETAYSPWIDLIEGIISLNMSRKNAARLERLIGVNTGRLDPIKAARYVNEISKTIKKSSEDSQKKSFLNGFFQTVWNTIIPIFGDTKGRLDINTVIGTPDIQSIEDIMFHVKRLGSALGIDPSLLGFGDLLSGGLGDGGFFRISVIAAMKAQLLRRAMKSGIERVFDIHIAYKYGKTFLPGQKPWRVKFNAVSTAIEREERENLESRVNMALSVATLPQTIDPEGSITDRRAMANYIYTSVLKMDEEIFNGIFPKDLANKKPDEGDQSDGVFESADDKLKIKVYQYLEEYFEKGATNE